MCGFEWNEDLELEGIQNGDELITFAQNPNS